MGQDDQSAVSAVVKESHGSVRTLEAAYGRALALVNELPGDKSARDVVVLMNKAIRAVIRS